MRYDKHRKTTLLESDEILFRRCPKNHKSVWGFDFSNIAPLLENSKQQRYPWNWIGLQFKKNGILTKYFLENHYFRRQEHNTSQYTVSSAIKWVIRKSKPELLALSTSHLSALYNINPEDIQYDKPIYQNASRFPQIAYLQNPGHVIRMFYLSAMKERNQKLVMKPTRTRRRYTSNIRFPTMKRLQELLQQLCEDPLINQQIFGYQTKIYLDDESFLSLDNIETFDEDGNEPSVTAHWWRISDIFKKHLSEVLSLKIVELIHESKSIVLPFKIWMDGTSTGTHSIIKVTASLVFDSTQFHDLPDIIELKEFSKRFSRIFNWILLPLPESKFAYKEVGKILRQDLLSLLDPVITENETGRNQNIFLRPLLLSADAKAARIASGVSGGGIYRCQMCYIQQTQIPDYSVACRILLRHWQRTTKRVVTQEKIKLGKDIIGLIDSNKLLNCSRIPCHCWRDIFSHPLLRDR